MIIAPIVIALVQVFVVQQLGFLGIIPMLWLVYLSLMQHRYIWQQVLAGAAAYSLLVTTLSVTNPLLHLVGTLAATATQIIVMRTAQTWNEHWQARWWWLVSVAALVYMTVWVLIQSVPIWGHVRPISVVLVIILSTIGNATLISAGAWLQKRLHV